MDASRLGRARRDDGLVLHRGHAGVRGRRTGDRHLGRGTRTGCGYGGLRRASPQARGRVVILVDAAGVSMSRPGRPLFADLSLTLSTTDRLGAVGINGTRKSPLLRVLAGEVGPESGLVRRGRGVSVGVLEQRPDLPPGPVRQAVDDGSAAA